MTVILQPGRLELLATAAVAKSILRLAGFQDAWAYCRQRALADLTARVQPGVITKTLLSAALLDYPAKRVVLLIDNPPDPSDVADAPRCRAGLPQTRSTLPHAVNRLEVCLVI